MTEVEIEASVVGQGTSTIDSHQQRLGRGMKGFYSESQRERGVANASISDCFQNCESISFCGKLPSLLCYALWCFVMVALGNQYSVLCSFSVVPSFIFMLLPHGKLPEGRDWTLLMFSSTEQPSNAQPGLNEHLLN